MNEGIELIETHAHIYSSKFEEDVDDIETGFGSSNSIKEENGYNDAKKNAINNKKNSISFSDLNPYANKVKDAQSRDYSLEVSSESDILFEDEEFPETKCSRCIEKTHGSLVTFLKSRKKWIKYILLGVLFLLFLAYFTYVCVLNWRGAIGLIVLSFIVVFIIVVKLTIKYFRPSLLRGWNSVTDGCNKYWNITKW